MHLCMSLRYHIPLTTRVPVSLILMNPRQAAAQALSTLKVLQEERRLEQDVTVPLGCNWAPSGPERCCAKLGYSYEAMDVYMVDGEAKLAEALVTLSTQSGYTCDCVYVQQRVPRVDLEARVFVLRNRIVKILYTRFTRVDGEGKVRDYKKASAGEALREWFYGDELAWQSAQEQIATLTERWCSWLHAQASDVVASVRIDYMLQRLPGRAEVWTGEVGEQGYSTSGLDPTFIHTALLDGANGLPHLRASPFPS